MTRASLFQPPKMKKMGFLPNFDYFRRAQNSIFNSVDGFVIRTFGAVPHRAETGCPPEIPLCLPVGLFFFVK